MKLLKFLIVLLISLTLFVPVSAEENVYQVFDSNSGFSESFSKYKDAYAFFDSHKDEYDNLFILNNGKVIAMEYGIVEFNDTCEYYSLLRKTSDYINGSYGIDGAYLYTSTDQDKVYFVVSGDRGYTSINNLTLHPYNALDVSISSYLVKDGYLYHNIKTQLDYEYYTYCFLLDIKPSFMKDNQTYYSYDGHFFYDDFYKMIDDYNNKEYSQAINETPYYNYYQYLSHHSLSNYTCEELENYFYDTLGINKRLTHYRDFNGDDANDEVNCSQLYGNIAEFFNNQYIYGTNAMMLISSAIVESNYGKSLDSYLKNNLYINAAYESRDELNNDRYDSIGNSIYAHTKYFIGKAFSNHLKSNYYGTYLGNKAGGINIEYTLDHYYGEKVASAYFKLDKDLGFKDNNDVAIGVIKNTDKLTLYKDPELNVKLFSLNNVNELSFVINDVGDMSYRVLIDSSFNDDYKYDFAKSVAYIDIHDFAYVINSDKIKTYSLNKLNYDFNGGEYYGDKSLSLNINNGDFNPYIVPYKDGYEFVGYDTNTDEAGTITYIAKYIKIDSIEIGSLLIKQKDLLPYPNIDNAYLNVKYEDGTSKKVTITSDMLSKYDQTNIEAQDIAVTYNGLSTSQTIQIDDTYYEICNSISEAIRNDDYKYVRDNIDMISYPYSMNEIKQIDYYLKQDNNRNYVINDKTGKYDFSISGLDLSLNDDKNFSLIEDTYYVIIDKPNAKNYKTIEKIANGYGLSAIDGLNISFKFNYQNIKLSGPAVVQIDVDNKQNDCIYSIYQVNSNNDIVKCRTTQSNKYIQFIIEEEGDYVVLSMPSVNKYNVDDYLENLSYDNMGFDNNRINIEFMIGLILVLLSLALISFYYVLNSKKEKQWKDYKKSLLKVDTVQEEKLNN